MKNRKLFLTCGLFLLLAGCSGGGKSSRTTLTITSGSVLSGGTEYAGGIFLQIVEPVTKESKTFDLSKTNVVAIPVGTWDFFVVSYAGAGAWQGATACGGATGVVLAAETEEVKIETTAADCAIAPYAGMQKTKAESVVGAWDNTNWEQSKWAP